MVRYISRKRGRKMTLVDIEAVITWLWENIDRYAIEMGDAEGYPVRTFFDLKKDLREWAEKEDKK
jgi:hypothetical protein